VTVVVTGAAGHVGANLVSLLVARGAAVRAVDRVDAPSALAGLGVAWERADVLEPASIRAAAHLTPHPAHRNMVPLSETGPQAVRRQETRWTCRP